MAAVTSRIGSSCLAASSSASFVAVLLDLLHPKSSLRSSLTSQIAGLHHHYHRACSIVLSDEAAFLASRLNIQMSTPPRAFSERPPLAPNTNEARTDPQTPLATAKTPQSHLVLRHNVSFPPSHPHLDSSESIPSAHASIYEASVFDPSTEHVVNRSNENINCRSNDNREAVNVGHHEGCQIYNDFDNEEERRAADEFAWSNCVPVVYSPHRLEPITEKNSLVTLQTKTSKASFKPKGIRPLTDKSSQATLPRHHRRSNLSLRPQPSASTLLAIPTVQPTHRKSFSLPSLRRSNKSSSSSVTLTQSNYLSTLPIRPKRPPPERKPTPPGLPTFNTPAAINYRLPAPPTRFRDHFRSSKAAEEYRRQTRALPRGVVMRGDNGEMIRGRWRAVPSGHGVGGQHPWIA